MMTSQHNRIKSAAWCILESRRDYTQPADPHHLSLLECIYILKISSLQWENWFCRPSENLENLYRTMEMRICNPEFKNQPQPCEGTWAPDCYCGILSCFDHSYHVWYYDIKWLHWKPQNFKSQKRTTRILGNYRYGFQNLFARVQRANSVKQ